jgi:hypothetical protein
MNKLKTKQMTIEELKQEKREMEAIEMNYHDDYSEHTIKDSVFLRDVKSEFNTPSKLKTAIEDFFNRFDLYDLYVELKGVKDAIDINVYFNLDYLDFAQDNEEAGEDIANDFEDFINFEILTQ